jgi:hypothetical protein
MVTRDLCLIVMAIILSGCGLAMQAQRKSAPHSMITDPQKIKNAEASASEFITMKMKDPGSATFRYSYPPVYGLLLDLTTVNQQGTFL